MKISNLREIEILKFFAKKIRQIEVRSALLSYNVNKLSRVFFAFLEFWDFLLNSCLKLFGTPGRFRRAAPWPVNPHKWKQIRSAGKFKFFENDLWCEHICTDYEIVEFLSVQQQQANVNHESKFTFLIALLLAKIGNLSVV